MVIDFFDIRPLWQFLFHSMANRAGRTGNKQGNHVMKTVAGFSQLQEKTDNPAFITGFPCLFLVLPCLALQCRVCERMSCELSVIWDNLIFSILTFMCKALSGRCLYLQCFLGFTGFSGCVPCRAVVKFSNPGSVGTSVTWHDVVKFLNWDVISGDVQPVLCRETPWSTLKKA